MWRETDRRKYRQAGDCLPSDLTDPEWERLAQLIPPAKPGGRPRKDRHALGYERDLLSFCEPVARGAVEGASKGIPRHHERLREGEF